MGIQNCIQSEKKSTMATVRLNFEKVRNKFPHLTEQNVKGKLWTMAQQDTVAEAEDSSSSSSEDTRQKQTARPTGIRVKPLQPVKLPENLKEVWSSVKVPLSAMPVSGRGSFPPELVTLLSEIFKDEIKTIIFTGKKTRLEVIRKKMPIINARFSGYAEQRIKDKLCYMANAKIKKQKGIAYNEFL